MSSKEEADQNIAQKYHDLQKVITLMCQFAIVRPSVCVWFCISYFVAEVNPLQSTLRIRILYVV